MASFVMIDDKHLKELQKGLKDLPDEIAKVTTRAISRGLDVMRTEAWKCIKDTYNIRQADVYKYITLIKPSYTRMSGALVATAPHIPISKFKMSPSMPQPGSKPVVTFSIKKGESETIQGAFVAIMKSGHKGLFVRRGSDRKPDYIDQKFTIGIAEMIGAQAVRDKVEKAGHEAFEYEFGRQADLALKKALDHKE